MLPEPLIPPSAFKVNEFAAVKLIWAEIVMFPVPPALLEVEITTLPDARALFKVVTFITEDAGLLFGTKLESGLTPVFK